MLIRMLNSHVVGLYRKNQIGVNCPDDEIISKESICKAASAVVGLKFSNSRTNDDAPAGCYWRFEVFHISTKLQIQPKLIRINFIIKEEYVLT